jgi:ornithine carbamoyltransferase
MKYEDILEFAKNATIPCVNLLCDKNHPTQAIADIITIKKHFKDFKKVKLAFVGACNNNVARSLIEAVLMSGGEYVGVGPKSEFPSTSELNEYKSIAKKYNGKISFSSNTDALKGCNVIYQDVFLDLGESQDL